MRLAFNPGSEAISLRLRAGGGVTVEGAELWRMNAGGYVRVTDILPDAAGAEWTNLARSEDRQPLVLQLNWRAFAPSHARWRYPVTITLVDQAGALLAGRDGHMNPVVIPCDIGSEIANWGHHQQPISIV